MATLGLTPAKARIVLPNVGMFPRYLPTGHLVYVANGTLYAVPFDPDGLEVRGSATPVLEDVSSSVAFGSAQVGLLRELSAGNPVPTVSPDGRWVAYASIESGVYEVYVRAFPDTGRQWAPAPDGKRFAVLMSADGPQSGTSQRNAMLVLNFFDEVRRRVAGRP